MLLAGVASANDATRKDGRNNRTALDIASVSHHYGNGGSVVHTLRTYKPFTSRLLKGANAVAFAFDTNSDYKADRLAFVLWYQGHLRGVVADGRGKPLMTTPVSRPNSRTVAVTLPVRLFGESGRYQWLALTTYKDKKGCKKTCTDLAPNSGLIVHQLYEFEQLSISITGSGRVVGIKPAVDCASTCSARFRKGTPVRLEARAADGWAFTGWGGACAGMENCTVVMDQAKSVTATFVPMRALSVSVEGPAAVMVSPPYLLCHAGITPCVHRYVNGTSVTLTAQIGTLYLFDGWSGACTGTSPVCTVTMDADKTVTVRTRIRPSTLAVTVDSTGSAGGRVTSAPLGIDCPGDCSETYTTETYVTLTATPDAGSVFDGWTGIWCQGLSPTCTLQMWPGAEGDRRAAAAFSPASR